MDTKSITAVIVGLMVSGLILVAFVPIFTEVTATTETYDNTSSARYQMKALEVGDRWERANGVWSYDGEYLTNNNTYDYGILFTDNLALREVGSLKGTNVSTGGNTITSAESVTVDDGEGLLFNDTGSAFTYTYGFGAVQKSNLIMKTRESSAYVLNDTVMYVTGVTQLVSGADASQVIVAIYGSIKDGFQITATKVSNGTATDISIGEVTVNAVPVAEGVDLYLFTGITFDISATYGGDSVTTNAIYSSFVMPKEVTFEKSIHGDTAFNSVINIIPLLAGVGLLMAGVYYFISRK